MLSCGKILPAPVEIVCLLRAELVIVKSCGLLRKSSDFFYAAGTTQKQQPANFHSAVSIFQIGLYIFIEIIFHLFY